MRYSDTTITVNMCGTPLKVLVSTAEGKQVFYKVT